MDDLTAWLNGTIDEHTLRRVGMFFGAVLATLVVAKIIEWLVSVKLKALADKSTTALDDVLVETLGRPVYLGVILFGVRYAIELLGVPESAQATIQKALVVALTMLGAWTLNRLISQVQQRVVMPWVAASESKLDDQIVPIVEKTLRIAVWTFALLICFSNLGVDVVSLLAGLGIGGVAVALAAQDTLANMFGSVTIFTDQPFQVGDLIEVDGYKGVVTEVGLRTCRIRTIAGERVRIPNKDIAAKPVVNHTIDGAWRYEGAVRMTHRASPEQVAQALAALQEIVDGNPNTTGAGRVYFRLLGESALELAYVFFVTQPVPHRYRQTLSEINLAIVQRFAKEGWTLAFPGLSLYVEQAPPVTAAAVSNEVRRES